MIKKHGLWGAIKYYCIIQFLVFGIVLYLIKDITFTLLLNAMDITTRSPFYELLAFAYPLLLLALWIFIVFYITREKLYKFHTGRNYSGDNGTYGRSYHELVAYFKNAEPHKLDTDTPNFPMQSWKDTQGLVFGMDGQRLITYPSNTETNIAIFGPPGAGKTSGIAIPNAMCFKGSVLAVDIKGDIYNYVSKHSKRKIVRFCPDHPNALDISYHFDPFAGIEKMNLTEKKLFIENMATVLIPEEGGSDGNYFTSRARKMFQGLTLMLLHERPEATFPEVLHAILEGNIFAWITMVSDDKYTYTPAKELIKSFYGNNEKNISGVFDALTTALIRFSNPILDELLSSKGKCISTKYLDKGYDIYLQISQEHLDAYAPLFTLIIQSLSTEFTKRPDSSTGANNRPILMLLDEFPQLTFSYNLINSNLSTLRSKSIIIMLIQQNLSQLTYRYTENGVSSVIGNCNLQIILGSNDTKSSKIFSDLFGEKRVLKLNTSLTMSEKNSSSRSCQEATERVFPPEYFGDLPSNGNMIMYFKGKYAECKKINCYK